MKSNECFEFLLIAKAAGLTLLLYSVLQNQAHSHHSTSAQFDASKIISVSGVITDMAFVNPHSYVYLDVTDERGEIQNWNCELRSASVLIRSGWSKEMFANGTQIDIVGVPSRKDPVGCYVETISFDGGPVLERYAQIKEETEQTDEARPETTAWGDPHIAGYWAATQNLYGAISGPTAYKSVNEIEPLGGVGSIIELTDAGQAAKDLLITSDDTVTGRLDCQPRDFFRDWTFDQLVNEIIQEQDKITLKIAFMSTERVIHLGMTEHPSNIEPTLWGHSIGHWEGNTLIVDTVGFSEHITVRGSRSEQFHATERFILDAEEGSLTRFYQGSDPLYWTEQQSGEQVVFLTSDSPEPYNCDDRAFE